MKPSRIVLYAANTYPSSNELLYNAIREHRYFDLLRIPGIGRGLFAACDGITKGTVVHREDPIVSISAQRNTDNNASKEQRRDTNMQRQCPTCQLPLAPNDSKRFCSARCEEYAWNSWLGVESTCNKEPLEEYCASNMVNFPLLAWKIACQTVQQQYPRYDKSVGAAHSIDSTDLSLGALCYVSMVQEKTKTASATSQRAVAPKEWTESYHIAMEECKLKHLPGAHGVVTLEYWYSILSRVHVNAFRLDIVDPYMHHSGILEDYNTSLKRAAAAAIGNETGIHPGGGSAVYLLASMANHSCVPNMDVRFPDNNHTIEFVALDDVQKHSHLTISYIDQGLHVEKRQQALLQGYGFACQCEQCVDDLRGY